MNLLDTQRCVTTQHQHCGFWTTIADTACAQTSHGLRDRCVLGVLAVLLVQLRGLDGPHVPVQLQEQGAAANMPTLHGLQGHPSRIRAHDRCPTPPLPPPAVVLCHLDVVFGAGATEAGHAIQGRLRVPILGSLRAYGTVRGVRKSRRPRAPART